MRAGRVRTAAHTNRHGLRNGFGDSDAQVTSRWKSDASLPRCWQSAGRRLGRALQAKTTTARIGPRQSRGVRPHPDHPRLSRGSKRGRPRRRRLRKARRHQRYDGPNTVWPPLVIVTSVLKFTLAPFPVTGSTSISRSTGVSQARRVVRAFSVSVEPATGRSIAIATLLARTDIWLLQRPTPAPARNVPPQRSESKGDSTACTS